MISPERPKRRLLVIGNRLLGDSLDSFPALQFLFDQLPSSGGEKIQVDLLSYRYTQSLYQKSFPFNRVFLFDDRHDYLGKENPFRRVLPIYHLLKALQKRYLGICIFPGGLGWAVWARLLHPQWVVGHRTDYRGSLLSHGVGYSRSRPNYENCLHLSEKVISLLSHRPEMARELEKERKPTLSRIQRSLPKVFPIPGSTWKNKLLSHLSIKKLPTRYLVMAPTASEKKRTWDEEKFYSLAEKLIRKDYGIFWVGLDKEFDFIEKIFQGKKKIGHNIAGLLDLSEVFALIRGSCGFLGNDSGLPHASTMLGIPTVIIYGPANPTLSRPLEGIRGRGKPPTILCQVYREYPEISHAQRRERRYQDLLSIKHITVDEVWEKVAPLFP